MSEVTWKNRVQVEISEILARREVLCEYMTEQEFQTLDLVSQTLMHTQVSIMGAYIDILCARIRAAGGI